MTRIYISFPRWHHIFGNFSVSRPIAQPRKTIHSHTELKMRNATGNHLISMLNKFPSSYGRLGSTNKKSVWMPRTYLRTKNKPYQRPFTIQDE